MSSPDQKRLRNRLLLSLAPADFSLLKPYLEPLTLELRFQLNVPNEPTPFVYFLDEGVASILLGPERTTGVEVGMVGREGLIGTSVVLGARQSPHHCFI